MFDYFSSLLFYLFFGAIIGIIKAWNNKVLFWIWVIGLVFIVISGFVVGTNNLITDLTWYQFIYQLIWFAIGMFAGNSAYKNTFRRN